MPIEKGQFVRVHYTGKLEDGTVFDTTREDVAQEHGLHNARMQYEPAVVCIGQGHLLVALENALIGTSVGDTKTITLSPEEGFGKKSSSMIKLMPITLFRKEKIQPHPGLDVTVDNMRGTIKSVTGNRVIVDFNHQLAGKELTYELHVEGLIEDVHTQVQSLVAMMLRFPPTVTVEETKATISLPIELPEELQKQITEKITELTTVTEVVYSVQKSGDTKHNS